MLHFGWRHKPIHSKGSLAVDVVTQRLIDSLKTMQESQQSTFYTINPNYMSEYQAYRLGLPLFVLDSIRSFRDAGGTIYSIDDFKTITELPDTVLERMTSRLRFPPVREKPVRKIPADLPLIDLNAATAQELTRIPGIGPKLSARIVKFRNALGGFLLNEQVYDVYGLDSLVVGRLLNRFAVQRPPQIEKISINTASVSQLAANVYISWDLAREIVSYRQLHGTFNSWSDLEALEHLPDNRIARIRLYLSLEKKWLE